MVALCNQKSWRPRRRDNVRRGFSLVELLVVIVIILLLMGLLVPTLAGARRNAKRAATLTLMQSVATGVNQFKQDTGRLPGHFSQEQLGQQSNQVRWGLTSMENALVELAGGAVPSDTPTPPGTSIIKLFYGETGDPGVYVDTALIGDQKGPSYLNLPRDVLSPISGQFHGSTPSSGMERMPDVVDPFGMPLLLWVKNGYAGENPVFASEYSVKGAPRRSLFYLTSNAGMLRSDRLGTPGPVDQCHESLLGWPSSGAASNQVADRLTTLTALLGHPGLPIHESTSTYGDPSSPLGDVVIHSAGADRVYLSNGHGSIQRAVYQLPTSGSNTDNRPIGAFDDLVMPAGG